MPRRHKPQPSEPPPAPRVWSCVPPTKRVTAPKRAQEPSPEECEQRRAFERQPMDRIVRVTEVDRFGNIGHTWECRAADVSRGGMGLRSRRMVHLDQGMVVEVPMGPGGASRVLFGIVRQSRYEAGLGYVIGIQFEAPPMGVRLEPGRVGRSA